MKCVSVLRVGLLTISILSVCVPCAYGQTERSRKNSARKAQDPVDEAMAFALRAAKQRRAQGWRNVGETEDYGVSYNIKTATHPQRGVFRIWTDWELKYTDDKGNYILRQRRQRLFGSRAGYEKFARSLKLFEVRCGERQFRILSVVDQDEAGKTIGSRIGSDDFALGAYSVPGSIAESILDGSCRELRHFPINNSVVRPNPRILELSPREIARRSFPSVVLLLTEDENGKPISLGSGFFVRSDLIATSRHVIRHASRIYVRLIGQTRAYEVQAIAGVDQERDLALLRINGSIGHALPLGKASDVAVGDQIYAIGNPEGLEGTFSQGVVAALRGNAYIQITAPISSGSSGGPVLNSRGEVIGIATAILEGGQNLNFAIPVSHLSRLVSQVGAH
jgi:Trypsin-like peptidase domain